MPVACLIVQSTRDVLITEQWLDRRSAHQLLQELPHPLVIEETLPVLGEHGEMPDRIIRAQPHKPAEQKVVVELLQQ